MKKDEFGFVTEKGNKQKKKGIKNFCAFAGAVAILGSVIGTCIYKANTTEDKSIVTDENITSSNEEVTYETKQVKVIKGYKMQDGKKIPIYETVTITVPVDENTIESKTYSKTR